MLRPLLPNDIGNPITTAIMIAAIVFTASCSRDHAIIKDYKLYDLDGSNQVIIGRSGTVAISDVTSYNLSGKRILFETGVLDGPAGLSGAQLASCRYGFVDVASGTIVRARDGGLLQSSIARRLMGTRKGAVSRSCVSRK